MVLDLPLDLRNITLNIEELVAFLTEIAQRGIDSAILEGKCGETTIHGYVRIWRNGGTRVELAGLSVIIPYSEEVNDRVLTILSHSTLLTNRREGAEFHGRSPYAVLIYRDACGDRRVLWSSWRPLTPGEEQVFLGE